MFMLVPLSGDNTQESTITSLDSRKFMAKLELEDNAEVIEITFITDIDAALNSGIDYLIIDSFEQDLENYLDYNVEVFTNDQIPGLTKDSSDWVCFECLTDEEAERLESEE